MPKRGENIYKRKDNRWEGRFAVLQPGKGQTKQFLLAPVQADGEKSFSELAGC